MEMYNQVDLIWGGATLFFIGILILLMKQKVLPLTILFLFAVPAWAVGPVTDPDRWALGEFLLVALLALFLLGWFTGLYPLLFTTTAPFVKRIFLYPLLKRVGKRGDNEPLITKEK